MKGYWALGSASTMRQDVTSSKFQYSMAPMMMAEIEMMIISGVVKMMVVVLMMMVVHFLNQVI